ncbi:MAG: terminase family protein [Bacteroidota bacterium]
MIPPAVRSLQRLDRQFRTAARRQPRRTRTQPDTAPLPPYGEWYRTTIPSQWGVPQHIAHLCGIVQQLIDGVDDDGKPMQRVCISMPPGHAKSDTVTRRLPIYWSRQYPGDSIVLTGYSQRFAEKHLSYPARELARERGELASTATALDEWEFANGTRLVCRGTGAAPTGVNPISLLICDDPIKNEAEARSEVIRDNVWDWWTTSIEQRFWPRTRAVIIATRWHEDDLIGRLQTRQPEDWTFINMPALAGPDGSDPLGRVEGEALWPEEKPRSFLLKLQRTMGRSFEALFQGNPTPREGSLFKVSMLELVDHAPVGLPACRGWDLAATENAGDWTSGPKITGPDADGIFYIEPLRFRCEPAERNRRIRQRAELDGVEVLIRVPQDPGAAGKEAAQTLVSLLAGFAVVAEPVSGKKSLRAEPLAAQVNAGNVRVVTGGTEEGRQAAADFIEEARQFPFGTYDDQIDGASDGFAQLVRPPKGQSTIIDDWNDTDELPPGVIVTDWD